MYHEEKMFQGEYYFKNAETDAWVQMPTRTLTYRLQKAERKVKELEEEIKQLKGDVKESKYKPMDKVMVTDNTSNHNFDIGEIVVLVERGYILENNWRATANNFNTKDYSYICEHEFKLS